MKRILALPLLLLLSATPDENDLFTAMKTIEPGIMKEYLSYLASDELEGRLAGYPGNDKATEFIAGLYKKAGLKPIGDEGSYYQYFNTRHGKKTRNTIALLPGTDLKDQYIVIGAHHDHVGKEGQKGPGKIGDVREDDKIWNGADDNGSGTTCVLTLVKAFKESGIRLRRSVIFMTFSAEEWGLDGSKHYVVNPIIPLAKTACMINMDMMGRGELDRESAVGAMGSEKTGLFREVVQNAADAAAVDIKLNDGVGGSSDMASFAAKKVPVISFHENGPCPDYHRVTDHVEKINFRYMSRLARMVFLTVYALGNRDERPVFNPETKLARDPWGPRLGVSLGAPLTEEQRREYKLDEGQSGLAMAGVVDGSVAGKAGLQKGDVIIRFNGEMVRAGKEAADIRRLIGGVKREVKVPIEYIRDGQRHKTHGIWPKK